ncbi:PilZ domain-containing protein [Peredibacter starrii]|uniref:PilZ domain-containing protein n=1 Tax=Peredibacter starrii TaxID=28202 RepID=A0AAX4HQ52_9BACT|nr:hypothetical protein [Peredibacter starrii]WPU65205.1 hypothetical protein SOO65_00390 [Peredibacter starrii]
MSQTFFSKQDPTEKLSRLSLLGSSRGTVIVWLKGKKEKHTYQVLKFDKDREEIVLDSKDTIFKAGETVLCSFELRGMNFFSETIFQVSISGYNVLQVKNILYKSERRSSYRLLTFPIYEVYVDFNLGEAYVGGKVVDMKSRSSQTGLFKNFLQIVGDEKENTSPGEKLKIRVQDLSTTGMAIHVGELESKHFEKDMIFENVDIRFTDEVIQIPEVKVVYVVDYISNDKNIKKYKVGLHFNNLPTLIDDQIGKKINRLLRENDFNKDFENFIK